MSTDSAPVKLITLDAASWRSEDDFYDALFPALGSPEWHGRNLNAVHDSLFGGINTVEPPFRVLVRNTHHASATLAAFFQDVTEVFTDASVQTGDDVSIEFCSVH